ncbi:MAG: AI-2E family transporter [Firmicutes bacterium]|nr:AI-2E family transporter [Bacillota bacterium]
MTNKLARMPRWQKIGAFAVLGVLLLLLLIGIYRYRSSLLLVALPFVISLVLAYLLSPLVLLMEQRRISRKVAIAVIYLLFALFIFIAWVRVVPLLAVELQSLGSELPGYLEQLQNIISRFQDSYRQFNLPSNIREMMDKNLDGLGDLFSARLERLYQSAVEVIGCTLLLLLVPVLTYYFLRDEQNLKRALIRRVPGKYRHSFLAIARDINCSLGAFLRGSLLVSFAVGLLTYICFLIIRLDFPLVLAGITGIMNLIPIIGPVIGALPALLIALLQSPFQALKVTLILVIIQQVEAQLIYPLIIGRSIGFHPLTIIFALLLAGKLFGFMGLILALPVIIVFRIFFRHLKFY